MRMSCLLLVMWLSAGLLTAEERFPAARLQVGDEYVWRGTFREELHREGSSLAQRFDLEVRMLVLERDEHAVHHAAILSTFQPESVSRTANAEKLPVVRFAWVKILPDGRISSLIRGHTLRMTCPLEGIPDPEIGMIAMPPDPSLSAPKEWHGLRPENPGSRWNEVRITTQDGARCFLLDWHIRNDPDSREDLRWSREDRVWVSGVHGLAVRLERTVESRSMTQGTRSRTETVWQLRERNRLPVTSEGFRLRKSEIDQMVRFCEEQLVESIDTRKLQTRIRAWQVENPQGEGLPWRAVSDELLDRNGRAELSRTPAVSEIARTAFRPDPSGPVFRRIGEKSPEFTASDVAGLRKIQSRRLLGRPILLIYYTVDAPGSTEMLRLGRKLSELHAGRMEVIGLVSGQDTSAWLQGNVAGVSFPILSAKEIHQQHEYNAAQPVMVLLDGEGVIRSVLDGWKPEHAEKADAEVRKWLRR